MLSGKQGRAPWPPAQEPERAVACYARRRVGHASRYGMDRRIDRCPRAQAGTARALQETLSGQPFLCVVAVSRCDGHAEAHGIHDLHNGGELWIAVAAERAIEAFAGYTRPLSYLCHATSAGNIAQRSREERGVAVLHCGIHVSEDHLLAIEMFGCVPGF